MAGASRLIVGLGNPGSEYEDTRHNIGFRVVDAIADKTNAEWQKAPQPAFMALSRYKGRTFGLVKPITFMNLSGDAVIPIARKLKIGAADILVIYDDIHLDPGVIRLRQSGSAGGHNGMQHIMNRLGANNFPRLRVGVGSNFKKGRQSDYVLSPFENDEQVLMEEAVQTATDCALTFLHAGVSVAMNQFNRKK